MDLLSVSVLFIALPKILFLFFCKDNESFQYVPMFGAFFPFRFSVFPVSSFMPFQTIIRKYTKIIHKKVVFEPE
jgi:hypothetical protein